MPPRAGRRAGGESSWFRLSRERSIFMALTSIVGLSCVAFLLMIIPPDDHDPSAHDVGSVFVPDTGYARASGRWPADPVNETFAGKFGSGPRVSLHVTTDKQQYRPGDTLFARILAFDSVERAKTGPTCWDHYPQIVGPKGDVVDMLSWFDGGYGSAMILDPPLPCAFKWKIPPSLPGGEYTFKLDESYSYAPAERLFTVRSYRAQRLRLTAEPSRSSYGFGEVAEVSVTAERSGGGVPAGAAVSVVARIDGQQVYAEESLKVPDSGKLLVSVPLPPVWLSGVGTVTVVVTDGGTVESTTASLPLVAAALDLRAYPESGDLVVGLPARVYLEAFLPSGEPAEVSADICLRKENHQAEAGACVASIETMHEGRGVSGVFKPQAGAEYELRVTKPASLQQSVPLPAALARGAFLRAAAASFRAGEHPVTFEVASTLAGVHRLALYSHEVEVAATKVQMVRSPAEEPRIEYVSLVLPRNGTGEGVLRATLFGPDGRPLAERLVFVEPAQEMKISLSAQVVPPTEAAGGSAPTAGSASSQGAACDGLDTPCAFEPGQRVRIDVKAEFADRKGLPTWPVEVGLTVTDARALAGVPQRRWHPRLPAMVLLENEVLELLDPMAYLPLPQGSEPLPNAPRATPAEARDLLLGTQGWRRFAYDEPLAFLRRDDSNKGVTKDAKQRMMAVGTERYYNPPYTAYALRADNVMFFADSAGRGGGVFEAAPVAMAMARGAVFEDNMVQDAAPPPEELAVGDMVAAPMMAEEMTEDFSGADAAAEEAAADMAVAADEQPGLGQAQGFLPEAPEAAALLKMASGDWASKPPAGDWERFRIYAHKRPAAAALEEGNASNGAAKPRSDFTETVLFVAGLRLGEDGCGSVEFDLSDAVTTFVARADGATGGGVLGAADLRMRSSRLFFLEAKLPPQVTAGDTMLVPVTAVTELTASSNGGTVEVNIVHGGPLELSLPESGDGSRAKLLKTLHGGAAPTAWALSGEEGGTGKPYKTSWKQTSASQRALLPLVAGSEGYQNSGGTATVNLTGIFSAPDSKKGWNDAVTQTIEVLPAGFPVEKSHGGMLTPGPQAAALPGNEMVFSLPSDYIPGTLQLSAMVYPSPVASLTAALERLIREPYGCFEQTSSTTYPMSMALSYMENHPNESSEALRTKARKLLVDGYKKLVGFESPGGGFDWFGRAPGHEALTAYGVLQFLDMQKVINVSQDMLQRTIDWILSRRDGKGGFLQNSQALDGFGGAPASVADAYILYSLVSAGIEGLDKEIDALQRRVRARGFDDGYVLGLAAATAGAAGRKEVHFELASKLVDNQDKEGRVARAETSITRSSGQSLEVETTAIAVLAWLHGGLPNFVGPAEKAVRWLASTCEDGRFGSTQGTVLAIKAILAYEGARTKSLPPSMVTLRFNEHGKGGGKYTSNGEEHFGAASSVMVDGENMEHPGSPLRIPSEDLLTHVQPGGEYIISIEQQLLSEAHKEAAEDSKKAASSLPYSLQLSWRSTVPPSSPQSPVKIETGLAGSGSRGGVVVSGPLSAVEGESVDVFVTVESTSDEKTGMVLAIVGIPGGLEVRHERLRELKQAKKIAMYEVVKGDVVLYWDGFKPREKKTVSFDAVASVPGSYHGAASRAYEYYNDKHKWWLKGVEVDIVAAKTTASASPA